MMLCANCIDQSNSLFPCTASDNHIFEEIYTDFHDKNCGQGKKYSNYCM